MAENINFIPATELPEAIGDKVNVLCLENGALKQKPGAIFGDEVCDMKIRYNFTDGSYKLVQGTYDKVVHKIVNDVFATVYCIQIHDTYKQIVLSGVVYLPDSNMIVVSADGLIFNVYPDNRIELSD